MGHGYSWSKSWGTKTNIDLTPDMGGALPTEYLDAFLAQPAPRRVPPDLAAEVLAANAYMKSHAALKWLNVIFTVLFLIPAILLFPWTWPVRFMMRHGFAEQGTGRIVSYEATGQKVNGITTYRVNMTVEGPDGKAYPAVNYVEGVEAIPGYGEGLFNKGKPTEGVATSVMYYSRDPRYAVFRGGRMDRAGAWILVFFVPVVIGTALLAYGARKKRRVVRLLRNGEQAWAEVAFIGEMKATVNGRPVYRMRFAFDHPGGRETLRRYPWGGRAEHIRSEALRKKRVRVLYDPARPARAVLLDMANPDATAPGEWNERHAE